MLLTRIKQILTVLFPLFLLLLAFSGLAIMAPSSQGVEALLLEGTPELFIPLITKSIPYPTYPIVFVSARDGDFDLYSIQWDGSELRQLTFDTSREQDPDCAAGNSWLPFNSNNKVANGIHLLNYNTGEVQWLENLVGQEPTWSPDGTYLVYSLNGDIFRVRPDGSDLLQITNGSANDVDPIWSPNGTQIAFASDRAGGTHEIYLMDFDGTNVIPLTDTMGDALEPYWSPDGTKITFQSMVDGDKEIYIIIIGTLEIVQLTHDITSDSVPVWSPDGLWILYESERDGNDNLYMMMPDGRFPTRITSDPSFDGEACWYYEK